VHPIFHRFKRTYWSSMRFSRAWMALYTYEYRITPARLDMMIAIARDPEKGIAQMKLGETLDVCGSVVTVMLDSLEELGYVERRRIEGKGPAKQITLTPLGRAIFDEIVAELLYDGFTEHAVRQVLSSNAASDAHTVRFLARTRRFFAYLRDRLFDGSTLLYPCYLGDGDRSPDHPYRRTDHVFRLRRFRSRARPPAKGDATATP
jgi:DNA-binding MarR family transcriptional regulator